MENQVQDYIGYVGTTSTRGSKGVYKIGLNAQTGKISILDIRPAYNSGALRLSQDKKNLYVLSEGMIFRGKATGAITAYNVENGAFEEQNWAYTDGQRPCFVDCDDKSGEIYIGNFFNGTLCVFQREADGSVGPRKAYLTHPRLSFRGTAIHCVAKSPAGRYLASLDVAGGMIYIYDCEDEYRIVNSTPAPEGSAPRHMVFSADGRFLYINRQADEKVSVYRFDPNSEPMLTEIQTITLRTPEMIGRTEPAAIKLCPGHDLLAVSNRGCGTKAREDSVTLFRIDPDDGTLVQQQVIKTGGEMPRDMNFTPDGKYLVVGYQFQGYLDVYRLDEQENKLVYVGKGADTPSPVAIAF